MTKTSFVTPLVNQPVSDDSAYSGMNYRNYVFKCRVCTETIKSSSHKPFFWNTHLLEFCIKISLCICFMIVCKYFYLKRNYITNVSRLTTRHIFITKHKVQEKQSKIKHIYSLISKSSRFKLMRPFLEFICKISNAAFKSRDIPRSYL